MNQKIKFKIISFSSEQNQHPVSSLIVGKGWQSSRFCPYPQEITLQFYGIVRITKLQLISDSRKISSQVDILYYSPEGENRFIKYGYLEFSRNINSSTRQHKNIKVDIKCLYLRLLFHKPHQIKQNFFSQVGLHQILVYGNDIQHNSYPFANNNFNKYTLQQQPKDQYVIQKLTQLNNLKQKAVQDEDYEQANTYKGYIAYINKLGLELNEMLLKKQQAIQNEDYDLAQQIKIKMDKDKKQIQEIINGDEIIQEEEEKEYTHNNDNLNSHNDFQDNQFVYPEMTKQIQQSNIYKNQNNSKNKQKIINNKKKQIKEIPYDQRIIPTLQAKLKTQESQEFQKENQIDQQQQAEQISGQDIKDASILQEYFSQDIVKQFFSKKWKLKVKSLTIMREKIPKMKTDIGLIRCVLTCTLNSFKEVNFQIVQGALNLLQETLMINQKTHVTNRTTQMHNDLDSIIGEIIKKLSDNNPKIKAQSEQIMRQMIVSSLYGVELCCVALIKIAHKVINKQVIARIQWLIRIMKQKEINQQNIFESVIVFAVEQLNSQTKQTKQAAVKLVAICAYKDQKKVDDKIANIKPNTKLQIQTQQKLLKEEKSKNKK